MLLNQQFVIQRMLIFDGQSRPYLPTLGEMMASMMASMIIKPGIRKDPHTTSYTDAMDQVRNPNLFDYASQL